MAVFTYKFTLPLILSPVRRTCLGIQGVVIYDLYFHIESVQRDGLTLDLTSAIWAKRSEFLFNSHHRPILDSFGPTPNRGGGMAGGANLAGTLS